MCITAVAVFFVLMVFVILFIFRLVFILMLFVIMVIFICFLASLLRKLLLITLVRSFCVLCFSAPVDLKECTTCNKPVSSLYSLRAIGTSESCSVVVKVGIRQIQMFISACTLEVDSTAIQGGTIAFKQAIVFNSQPTNEGSMTSAANHCYVANEGCLSESQIVAITHHAHSSSKLGGIVVAEAAVGD